MDDYRFKYAVIGDSSVGKTSLLDKFVRNKFSDSHVSTIGFDYECKVIDATDMHGNPCRVSIRLWDTAGQERYRSVVKLYLRDAVCVLAVFDLANRESFNNISSWLEEINRTSLLYLIGNKSDKEAERQVPYNEAKFFAIENNMTYIETSAKTGEGVEEVFSSSVKQLLIMHDKEICTYGYRRENTTDLQNYGLRTGSTYISDCNC